MKSEPITNVVETDGMGELGVEQTHDMAPRGEAAGLFVHLVLSGQTPHKMGWNELAELRENADSRFGWFLFHRLTLSGVSRQPPLYSVIPGMTVSPFC